MERDLNFIAEHMLDWEERLSALLGLRYVDIHDIKKEFENKRPILER